MNLTRGNPHTKQWKAILIAAVCLTILGGGIVNLSMQRLAKPDMKSSDIEQRMGELIADQSTSPQSNVLVSAVDGKRVLIVGRLEVTPQGLFVVHDAPLGASSAAGEDVSQTPVSLFLAERGFVAVQIMRQNALSSEAMQQAQDARDFARACVEQALPCETYLDMSELHLRLGPKDRLA